jgi:predicted NUDIX family NTP pyrophosphohydrolase
VKLSAALCCYRGPLQELEVLLIHPGGPYFEHRDLGVWSFPKGECEPEEELLAAARREFAEEVGALPPSGEPIELGEIKQKNGKRVVAFAVAAGQTTEFVKSNEFELEWPPRSGQLQRFPEADRGGWFALAEAREMLVEAQVALLDRLLEKLS